MSTSPALRLSFGVVSLVACVLSVSDIFFGVITGPDGADLARRKLIAEVTAAHIAQQLSTNDFRAIEHGLDDVRERAPELLAVNVRSETGELIAGSGVAPRQPGGDELTVTMQSSTGEHPHADFYFTPLRPPLGWAWLSDRHLWILCGLGAALVAMTYFYLRRALLYLDPMSVVPDRLRTAFDSLTEGLALLDPRHRVVMGNKALSEMSGTPHDKLLGRRLEDAAHLGMDGGGGTPVWHTVMATGQAVRGVRVQFGHGAARKTGSLNCSPIVDGFGKVRGCLVTVADVTAIERSNDQLRGALAEVESAHKRIEVQNEELTRLALYDGLTGLLNRRAFFKSAGEAIERHTGGSGQVGVLMMDVDHFKSFNDRFGHATGDMVLQHVAMCLQRAVRLGDLAARYGGEEFCVLVENLETPAVLALAERVRAAIEAQADLTSDAGETLRVTISIGVAVARASGANLSAMVKSADAALYASKHAGRNRVTLAEEHAPVLLQRRSEVVQLRVPEGR